MTVSFDDLLARPLPEEDVTLADGTVVRVRGLSRAQVVEMQNLAADETALEAACLTAGLVDPVVPEGRVDELRAALTQGDVETILSALKRLSGLDEGTGA